MEAELSFSFRCGCLHVYGDGTRCEVLLRLPFAGCFCVQIGVLSGLQASLRSLRLDFQCVSECFALRFLILVWIGVKLSLALSFMLISMQRKMIKRCRSLTLQVSAHEAGDSGCIFLSCALPSKAPHYPVCADAALCICCCYAIGCFDPSVLQNCIKTPVDSVPRQNGNAWVPVLANPA